MCSIAIRVDSLEMFAPGIFQPSYKFSDLDVVYHRVTRLGHVGREPDMVARK
jgi:hypothetical protein